MPLTEESANVTDSGNQVTGRREALHMTIEQLAAEAGVSADTLSDWERGRRKPRGSTVEAVAKALDRLEAELGIGAPQPLAEARNHAEPHIVTIKMSSGMGVDVVVSGPVENIAELRDTVERLMRAMGDNK